ncbi:MAG: S41 family peptidase, partial [Patescibacteria group bacterium]
MRLRTLRNIFLILTLCFLSGVIGWRLGHAELVWQIQNNRPSVSIINKEPAAETKNLNFALFWDVWKKLEQKYVDKGKIDSQKMFYGAIEGVTASLGDPYTVFLPPKENADFKADMAGNYEGIGAQLGMKDKRVIVIAPLSGFPAEKAGVKAGDYILKVNNEETINWSVPEAVTKIRGPKGSEVILNIYRESADKPFDIKIKRETIVVKSLEVEYKTVNNKKIAVMKLSRFGDDTENEWKEEVDSIINNKADGIILDMRNNPGGYLNGAVFVASEFLKDGLIVTQENYAG